MTGYAVFSDQGLEAVFLRYDSAAGYCRDLQKIGVKTRIQEVEVDSDPPRSVVVRQGDSG